jgi:hypothetical protein
MTTREHYLVQIYSQFKARDFEQHLNDFNVLIELLNDLQDSIYHGKSSLKPWRTNLEILIAKFSILCSSISQISAGTKIKARGKEIVIYDISSVYVLSRSLIVSYLIINYLNFTPSTDEQGEFRNDLYALAGLSHRQDFDTIIEEGKKKKAEEKAEIEQLIKRINKNIYFKSLATDKRKRLMKDRPAKEISWENLLKTARIQNREYLLVWKLYSNYAHSEYLSSIQLKEYLNDVMSMKRTVLTSLVQNIATLSILILDITDNFLSARLKFNVTKQETRTKVEFWGGLGRTNKM